MMANEKVTFTKWLGHRNTKYSFLCNLKRNCPNCSLIKCDENTSSISGTKRHSSIYFCLTLTSVTLYIPFPSFTTPF